MKNMPSQNNDPGGKPQQKKFPRIMIVMISVQLVQAFSQNVMLSIKAIFITTVLGYGEDSAVMISHIFISFEPIAHLTGAILADSTFGKWKVIVAGMVLMRVPDVFFILSVLPWMPNRIMFLTAVTLATFLNIHLPSLNAFFSEQFHMPDQEKQLKRYYNVLYWGRNAVSVVGAFSGSRLANMNCFGQNQCYFGPFAVWVATEIIVAVIIVALGGFFVKKPPTSSVILHFFECIGRAIYNKARFGKEEQRNRWIDHADDVFTDRFRDDVFVLVNVSYFFMLGILYWSLYDQTYTRFIYQGAKLDPYLFSNFRVYPGDSTILNPIMVIILLPLLEYVIYPICSKMNVLKTDLQKVGFSEYLVATAFVAAAILEWQIRAQEIHPPPPGTAHLVIFNGVNQGIDVSENLLGEVRIEAFTSRLLTDLPVKGTKTINVQIRSLDGIIDKNYSVTLEERKGVGYVLTEESFDRINGYESYNTDPKKSREPHIRCICASKDCQDVSIITGKGKIGAQLTCKPPASASEYKTIKEGKFRIFKDKEQIGEKITIVEHLDYTLVLLDYIEQPAVLFMSNPHYRIPFWWIIPQIFIMTLGEIMHAIPWRLFIYTQSPPPMRSVVFALDLLSRSLGDLLVAIVAATSFLEQIYEFILYASAMYVVSVLFTVLAIKYKPHQSRE